MKNYISQEEFARFSNITERAVIKRRKALLFGSSLLIVAGIALFLIALYFMLSNSQANNKRFEALLIVEIFGLLVACFGALTFPNK